MRSLVNKEQTPQEFAKEHWKEIFAISSTLAGAVILLLIRYHKKRRSQTGMLDDDKELLLLEEDARESNRPHTPLILDLMPDLRKHIPDAEALSEQLAQGLPERTTELENRGSRSLWKRWRRGNPREVMQTIGKIK